jgi:hypothetical protein
LYVRRSPRARARLTLAPRPNPCTQEKPWQLLVTVGDSPAPLADGQYMTWGKALRCVLDDEQRREDKSGEPPGKVNPSLEASW